MATTPLQERKRYHSASLGKCACLAMVQMLSAFPMLSIKLNKVAACSKTSKGKEAISPPVQESTLAHLPLNFLPSRQLGTSKPIPLLFWEGRGRRDKASWSC